MARAAEPVRLDAGSLVSPVADGFSRLDAEGCADPRATWVKPPWRTLPGLLPDPLSADALLGGTLHVDLPEGTWHVWAMLGHEPLTVRDVAEPWGLKADGVDVITVPAPLDWDALRASDRWLHAWRPTFRPGSTAWERQADALHTWQEADLVVGPGGVDLTPYGRALEGLVLADADHVEAERATIEDVQADRRAAWLGAVGPADDGHEHALGNGPFAAAAGTWASPPALLTATIHPAIHAELAPTERRSWLWWLLPADRPVDVTVRAPAGVDVEIAELTWLDTAGWTDRTRRPRPALIAPVASRLPGGQGLPVGLVVTLTATAAARPGHVRGYVELLRDGEILPVPLDVDVLPVTLPPSPVAAGFIVQPVPLAVAVDGRDAPSVAALLDADLERMARLGFTAVSFRHLVEARELDDDTDAALALSRHAFATWAQLGGTVAEWGDTSALVRGRAYVQAADDPLDARLTGHLAELLDVAAASPVPVVARAWEEELWKRADAPALAAALLPEIRAVLPQGVRLGASMGHPLSPPLAGAGFDVVYLGSVPPLSADRVAQARATGADVWAYNQPPGRSAVWIAWATGAAAVVQWHWNAPDVDPTADVHAAPERVTGVHLPDGRLAHSPVAEAMAQGVQDVRWLAALQAAAEAVAAGDRSRAWRAEATDALALLDRLRALAAGVPPTEAHDGEALDPDALDAAMERVRAWTPGLAARARRLP